MKWRKKAEEDDDRGFQRGASPATPHRITPLDIQEKEFHRSSRSRGGYVMREVDEFLDEVTDTLTAVLAENERLRQGMPAAPSAAPAAPTADAGADRTAMEAFLRREKAFLQELGTLVQAHAEELKSMVRSARSAAPAAAAPAQPPDEAGAAAEDADAVPDAAEATDEPAPAEPLAAEEAGQAEAPAASPEANADEPDVTVAEADEPIRLEEPAPARRRGTEDDPDRSLRELFWGEE